MIWGWVPHLFDLWVLKWGSSIFILWGMRWGPQPNLRGVNSLSLGVWLIMAKWAINCCTSAAVWNLDVLGKFFFLEK